MGEHFIQAREAVAAPWALVTISIGPKPGAASAATADYAPGYRVGGLKPRPSQHCWASQQWHRAAAPVPRAHRGLVAASATMARMDEKPEQTGERRPPSSPFFNAWLAIVGVFLILGFVLALLAHSWLE